MYKYPIIILLCKIVLVINYIYSLNYVLKISHENIYHINAFSLKELLLKLFSVIHWGYSDLSFRCLNQ